MTAIQFDEDHKERVKQELTAVGMNGYGLLKAETRHLPGIIHEDEHIGGVIYGRSEDGGSMMVATNRRLLHLDHKLFFKKTDEISYNVVSGVSFSKQGDAASITVHTKLGDFTLRYVSLATATHFVHYIEDMQLERDKKDKTNVPPAQIEDTTTPPPELSQEGKIFLASHDTAVLSTIDEGGNVEGAAIYYTLGSDNEIFFVTKSETEKARDILKYHQVALTIYDTQTMQTLQITGNAGYEQDQRLAEEVSKRILKPHLAGEHLTVPPVLHIAAGDYVVIGIKPKTYKFHDYKTW